MQYAVRDQFLGAIGSMRRIVDVSLDVPVGFAFCKIRL
jgi:hypothetical protein